MRLDRIVVATLLVAGCVDKSPPAPAVDPGLVAENLLAAPPTDIAQRIDAQFGAGIVYLGNTIESGPGPIAPGDKITIVHYWQVNQKPAKNWKVFSHLAGDQGDFANVDLTDMRKGHGPDTWSPGEVIRDRQTFILRKDWRSAKATMTVGLYQKGKHKVSDRMPVTGGQSKDSALVVATFDIDVSKAAPPAGTVIIKAASGPITIDGKADEAAWQTAAGTAGFQTAEGGPDPKGVTAAKLTWDASALYVFVASDDDDVVTTFANHDDDIWKNDVVEVFIDADASGKGYVELQVSPTNVQFDTFYPIGRPNHDKGYSANMRTAVNVRGTVNAGTGGDQGWDAELAIPWAAVKGTEPNMAVRLPPQPGDTWRLNVVRVDYPKGGQPAAASWNKIRYSDFHSIDRMLTVRFADTAGGLGAVPGGPITPTIAPPTGAPAPTPVPTGAPAPTPVPTGTPGTAAPATPPATPEATLAPAPVKPAPPKPAPATP